MLQADPDKVSPRAKKRGLPQVNEPSSQNIYLDRFHIYLLHYMLIREMINLVSTCKTSLGKYSVSLDGLHVCLVEFLD